MTTNTPCPRCGKTNPADVHTCTSKKDIEEWFKKQDQSTDSNRPELARKTIDEELFEQWRQHINDEIFKAKSYLQCLYQLNDAAILSSYFCGFKPTMKVENMTEAALKKLEEE